MKRETFEFFPLIIPLWPLLLVVMVVAVAQLVKIRDFEMEIHQRLHHASLEHEHKMQELEAERQRVKERK